MLRTYIKFGFSGIKRALTYDVSGLLIQLKTLELWTIDISHITVKFLEVAAKKSVVSKQLSETPEKERKLATFWVVF